MVVGCLDNQRRLEEFVGDDWDTEGALGLNAQVEVSWSSDDSRVGMGVMSIEVRVVEM